MSVVTDNYTLDLGEEGTLSLTKRIYDISEPDKRQSHFTKTITVPSSATNDLVFQGMFDVNFHLDQTEQFEPFFNPTKKAPCYLHTGTLEQVTGYAQLTDIVLNRYTNKVEYKLTIYGEIRDLFAELSNKRLSDLDLSEFNHTYNETSIENSWSAAIGTGYVYPMVDYGDDHKNYDSGANKLPQMNFWITEHFFPWVYVKTIVDKIIQGSGFKYYSNFFNTDLFKRLIFQGGSTALSKDEQDLTDLTVNAEINTATVYSDIGDNRTATYAYTNYPIIFDVENSDISNQYNNATGVINLTETGRYICIANLNVSVTNDTAGTITGFMNTLIQLVDSSGNILASRHTSNGLGAGITSGGTKAVKIQFNLNDINGKPIYLTSATNYKFVVRSLKVVNSAGGNAVTDLTISIDTGSKFVITPTAAIEYGDTMNMSQILDDKMTQKDFMMNIVRMFNLYIEPYWFRSGDANSGEVNTYLIEPRDDYFTSDVIDWTDNLDTEKDFIIKPITPETKFLKYSYEKDNDLLQETYNGQTGRVYGDYIHEIDNDFSKGTKEIKIGFTLTPMSDSSQKDHWFKPMPVIKSMQGQRRTDGKPRILFYNGLTDCSDWTFANAGVQQQYPLASNFDNWTDPTCDLNFSVPSAIYYQGDNNGETVFTNGTLFNRYYYKQVNELTNINSRMVECYMRLRPSDIHNLSFRPYYFIKDAYYRLYEVVDHNYQDTTLCKFLKISEATPITNALVRTKGGRVTVPGTPEKTPVKIGDKIPDTVGTGYGSLIVNGGGGVIGDGLVGQGYVKSIGGNNVLTAGLFNQEVLRDNIHAVGYNYNYGLVTDYVITGMEGSPYYIVVTPIGSNITITLPDPALFDGHIITIKRTDATNTVNVNDSTDTLFTTITTATSITILLADGNTILLN